MMGSSEALSVRTMRTPIRPGWDRFIYGSASGSQRHSPCNPAMWLLFVSPGEQSLHPIAAPLQGVLCTQCYNHNRLPHLVEPASERNTQYGQSCKYAHVGI
jgi:hypothetical protein